MPAISGHSIIIDQSWETFTQEDHKLWNTLFHQQVELLKHRAASEFTDSIAKLDITSHCIPKFSDLNRVLNSKTGFTIVPVSGLIPDDMFFKLLSERKFPSTCFIRRSDQIDYLEEPDIFHDVFGHVPLLVNPIFADFMEVFGHKGLEAINLGLLEFATRLYWYTVEFGLIQTQSGLRIYGAGIVSSKGESIYSLESHIPQRVPFDRKKVMQTDYRTDIFQEQYFVINNFNDLFQEVSNINWNELLGDLK